MCKNQADHFCTHNRNPAVLLRHKNILQFDLFALKNSFHEFSTCCKYLIGSCLYTSHPLLVL